MVKTEVEGSFGEKLKPSFYEVRTANLETDLDSITAILSQESVIEHLAAIAPIKTRRNIDKFRSKLSEKMPGINIDPAEIIIATKTEIGAYFKSKDSSKSRLLVAESVGQKPEVVGIIEVSKPSGGEMFAGISKLAVAEKARGKGVGDSLIKAANALALCSVEQGGWGCQGAVAGVIQVSDHEKTEFLFTKNNYALYPNRPDFCISWSNADDMFTMRSVRAMWLARKNFTPDPRDLPKSA